MLTVGLEAEQSLFYSFTWWQQTLVTDGDMFSTTGNYKSTVTFSAPWKDFRYFAWNWIRNQPGDARFKLFSLQCTACLLDLSAFTSSGNEDGSNVCLLTLPTKYIFIYLLCLPNLCLFTLPTKCMFIYSAHQQVTERARSASDNSFYHFKATFVIFSRLHLSMTTVQCSGSRAVGSVCQCLIVYSTTPLQYNSLKRETERGQLQLFDLTAFVDQHIVKAAQWVKCGGKVEVAQMFVFALH